MSNSRRSLPFANGGVVVSIDEGAIRNVTDLKSFAGLAFQQEGAGYAGCIVSSAIDGENSADAVAHFL